MGKVLAFPAARVTAWPDTAGADATLNGATNLIGILQAQRDAAWDANAHLLRSMAALQRLMLAQAIGTVAFLWWWS